MYTNTCDEIEFWVSVGDHNHTSEPSGLSKQNKSRIEELYKQGITKPHRIIHILREEGVNNLKHSQLINFLGRFKAEHCDQTSLSLSESDSWCKN